MTIATENFAIGRVDYIEQDSREIGRNASYKVGVRTALIVCLKCNHTWGASERAGLRQAMGAIHIECQGCRTTEQVHPSVFGL